MEPLLSPQPAPTESALARAHQLLDRYGVVTRETALGEGQEGGFAGVYPVLKALEERGEARRGYFVAGLGAAQFALPGAVDRLRGTRTPEPDAPPVVLAATDPAQPYGAALAWPDSPGRPARTAGAHVVLADGLPLVVLERGGRSLATFEGAESNDAWIEAIIGLVKDGPPPQAGDRQGRRHRGQGDPVGSPSGGGRLHVRLQGDALPHLSRLGPGA